MIKNFTALILTLSLTTLYAQDTDAPNLEFLEFLGEWEDQNGQWQDPTDLLNIKDTDLLQSEDHSDLEDTDHEE